MTRDTRRERLSFIDATRRSLRRLDRAIQRRTARIFTLNIALWFLFFFVVYLILLFKVNTYETLGDHFFFGLYSVIITGYILSRFLLANFHKQVDVDLSYEPTVTFVVPAKNEESNIAETIERFAEVDYPKEKIEVIAINDGSTDRTYEEMLRVAERVRPIVKRVEVVNWIENRGKRHGMAEGVFRAKHDIVIFIDSDSFIEPDAVTHLVKYFSDPTVGAVSGHTDVYNANQNLLTRMQDLRYYISFKVYKAAESVFGNVTCCPGCCSAYRREYLGEFIDEWLNQRFLGAVCTFGDDRALTNFILRKYNAVYSPEARAYTVVPDNFPQYVKQQQRWKKSWVRETLLASTFMWRRNSLAAFFFYVYVILAFAAPIVFIRAVFFLPLTKSQR
ncbi:MAG TPA: glycosyltransferase, partial [Candidatus Paceibacterota bacterium]|nr:glycosyltransferase [Candidatus Paceibacterota bacterium]